MDKQSMVNFLTELGVFDKDLLADVAIEGGKQPVEGRIRMQPIYDKIADQRKLTPKEIEYRVTTAVHMMRCRGNQEKIAEAFGSRDGRVVVTPVKFIRVMVRKFA